MTPGTSEFALPEDGALRRRIQTGLWSIWKERRALARSVPVGLTSFEQTQRSWARSITSLADVPAAYRSFFQPLEAKGVPFPLVIIAPSYEGFLHREIEKLVWATSDEVRILEKRGHKIDMRRYPIPGISCVEVSSRLLDARLEIMGLEGDALAPARTAVRFNAVTEYLFSPILTRIRAGSERSRLARPGIRDPFDAWGTRNFKFMNYAKRSLVGDEEIQQAILQPEISVRIGAAFGRTYRRMVSPTNAIILTDREVIAIREVPSPGGRERYGGVWDYMPLRRIDHLSIAGAGQGVVVLSIHLPGEVHVDLRYEASARLELDALLATFQELRNSRSKGNTAGTRDPG